MSREPILRQLAREVLGEEGARRIWKRIDIIGDIAIVKAPQGFPLEKMKDIARAMMRVLPYIRSVWLATGGVEGRYKVRSGLVHLAGEKRTETIYREHGCSFRVDVARVFITPRLSYEHRRIAELVEPGEVVVNMFAGVGLFSIIIACKVKNVKVYSIDINPDAYRFMVENVRLNRVEDRVFPILGDAAKVIEESLQGVATRVLMPLPELALDYLPYALAALRGRGYVHVYLHVHYGRGKDPRQKASRLVSERLSSLGAPHRVIRARRVRRVGPRIDQIVVDVEVEPRGS